MRGVISTMSWRTGGCVSKYTAEAACSISGITSVSPDTERGLISGGTWELVFARLMPSVLKLWVDCTGPSRHVCVMSRWEGRWYSWCLGMRPAVSLRSNAEKALDSLVVALMALAVSTAASASATCLMSGTQR